MQLMLDNLWDKEHIQIFQIKKADTHDPGTTVDF